MSRICFFKGTFRISLALITIFFSGCFNPPRNWDEPWCSVPQKYKPDEKLLSQRPPPDSTMGTKRFPIDLETTLRLISKNNLDIALARQGIHSAYAKVLLADVKFIPNINPVYRFWRHEGFTQGTNGDFVDVDKQNTLLAMGVSVKWPLGDAIYSRLSALKQYDVSNAGLDIVTQETLLNGAYSYFELLKQDRRIAISETAVKTSQKSVGELEASVKAGRGFQGDLFRAKAQLSHIQIELSRSLEDFKLASIKLASLLSLEQNIELYPADTDVVLLNMVEEKDVDKQILMAIENRPEITSIKKQVESDKFDHDSATIGPWIPELQIDTSFGKFGPVLGDLDRQNTFQILLGWKIGQGGFLDNGRQELADSRVRVSEIKFVRTVQKITEEVKSANTTAASRIEQLNFAKQEVKDAEDSLRLFQERQAAGTGMPFELLQAEDALTRAKLDYLYAASEYNKAQYNLFTRIGLKK